MKYQLFFFILILFASCFSPSQNQPTTEDDSGTDSVNVLTTPRGEMSSGVDLTKNPWVCNPGQQIGLITANSSEADIIKAYGEANVIRRDVGIGERSTAPGTVVFPDSTNELIIYWKEDAPYVKLDRIRVDNENTTWKTLEGISIGSSLEDLIEANNKEFEFYGFEWDYAGLVDTWNGGKLSDSFQVYLTPSNFDVVMPELLGEKKFPSSHQKAKEGNLKVSSMVFLFN